MRTALITVSIIIYLIFASPSFSHPDRIVAGNQPGEIYIVAPMSGVCGEPGFYYSSDYGETLELRDSAYVGESGDFGLILPDAADSSMHRFYNFEFLMHYITMNSGLSWQEISSEFTTNSASGTIPGEIYRPTQYELVERSVNYGLDYVGCHCYGFPSWIGLHSLALGSDSGEVFLRSFENEVYYSNDYAENFTFFCDIDSLIGMPISGTTLYNGTIPGELFLHKSDWQKLWRIYNFGNNYEVIANFDYSPLYPGCAAPTRNPGEVYYMVTMPSFCGGGTVHIYHTDNYGEDWIRFEHEWSPETVKDIIDYIPCDVSLSVYPNPFNPATAISYQLLAYSQVKLTVYDISGREVAKLVDEYQTAGNHEIIFDAKDLVSGVYFVRLTVDGGQSMVRKMVLMK